MRKNSLIIFISLLIMLPVSKTLAEESNFYHALLMQPECGGDGKQIQGKMVEYLESFIMESEIIDESGAKKIAKGKLLENDEEKYYGDRVFDFEKIKNEIIKTSNAKQKSCLRGLYRLGMNEWKVYLNKLSKDYSCGMELESDNIGCGFTEAKGTFSCSNDEKVVSGFSEKNVYYEMDKLTPTIAEETVNKNTCTKTKQGEDLSTFIQNAMLYLTEINDAFLNEEAKITSEKIGKEGPKKTEASNCPNPRDCGEKKPEQKNLELSEEAKEKACCEHISENWTSLGFSTVKGEKVSDHLCKSMMDKDKEKETSKIAEQCVRNLLGALGAGFVDGVKSFFSLFQAGWISSIPTLLHELKNNPVGTMTKIMKDMVGFDENVWSCVNDHTKVELGCTMLGKFVGSNFGFGAGVGLTAGIIKSTAKGVKAIIKVKTNGESLKTLASSGKSISLKKEFKDILKTTAKTAAKTPTWPLAAVAGTGKALAWGIKKANIVATAKTIVKAPGKAIVGTTALGAAVVTKTAAKVTKNSAAGAQSLDSFANSAFALSKDQFTTILGKSNSSLAKEINFMQKQTNVLGKDIKELQSEFDRIMQPGKNGKPSVPAEKAKYANDLDKVIKAKEASLNELNQKLTQSKVEFYKKSAVAEQRTLMAKNTERINELKKNSKLTPEQSAELSYLQNMNQQLRKNISDTAKLKNEEFRQKMFEMGLLSVSTTGVLLNQSNTSFRKKDDDKNKPKLESGASEISVPEQDTDKSSKPATEKVPTKEDKKTKPAEEVKPDLKTPAKAQPPPPTKAESDDLPPPPDMENKP